MTALPSPAVKVLLPKKENDSIFVTPAHDSYHCMADGMWGYSGFCRGKGWSDGFFSHKSFRHEIYVVAVASDPTLLFRLLRRKGNYLFRMTLFDELSAENASKPKMEFNGQPARLIAATKLVLEAEVPAKTLKDRLNEVPKRPACWRYNWPRCLSLRPNGY
jgi:hypothetical protein